MNKFLDMSSDMWDSYRTMNGDIQKAMQENIDILNNELYNVRSDLDTAMTEIDLYKTEINRLRTEINRLRTEKNNVIHERDSLAVEKDAMNTEVLLHRGTIANLEFQIKTQEQEIKTLQNDRESFERQMENYKTKYLTMFQSLEIINGELDNTSTVGSSFTQPWYSKQAGTSSPQPGTSRQARTSSPQPGTSKQAGTATLQPFKRKYEDISDTNDDGDNLDDDDVIYVATKYYPEEGKIQQFYIHIYSYVLIFLITKTRDQDKIYHKVW